MAKKRASKGKARKVEPEPVEVPRAGPAKVNGLKWASGVVPTPPSFLWPPVIMANALNLIEGRKGSGKSSIAAAVAAHVTGGPPLPGLERQQPRPVVWFAREESWEHEVTPRLVAAGADLAWVAEPELVNAEGRPRRITFPSCGPEIAEVFREANVGLAVFDPLASWCDPELNLAIPQQARCYLESLAGIARAAGTTFLLTRHVRKGSGQDPQDSGMGNIEIGNTCRTWWLASRHPTDRDTNVLASVAGNWTARGYALLYTLPVEGKCVRVAWGGQSELSADALTEGRAGAADMDEARDAINILKGLLAGGPRHSLAVIMEGKQSGIGERTLRKAKALLGVQSKR